MTDEEYKIKRSEIKEEWKQVILNGEKLNYDVSNTGRIRNHETKFEYKLSKIEGMRNHYEFINIKTSNGYKNMGIHRIMALMFIPIPKKYLKANINISSLIVDHIDNYKYHNIISNLQWLTNKENIIKSINDKNSSHDLLINKKIIKKICEDLCNGLTIYDVSKKYGCSEILIHDIRYGIRHKDISKKYKFPSKQITEEECIKICEELSKGKSANDVHEILGFSKSTIEKIICGITWKHISCNYKFPNKRIEKDMILLICDLLQEGKTLKEIHKITNVSKRVIERIRSKKSYQDISKDYTFDYSKFKVDDSVIHQICRDIESKKYIMKEISKRNNVSLSFVKDIKYRRSRVDISNIYKW